jgi:sterol desaturase/sphingolipid hydroxylase (fatty acid hydroxylase superfamily)
VQQRINYIALAVPFFFILIGIELWVARRKHRDVYRVTDAINDLSCGITQQMVVLFVSPTLIGAYVWGYEHRVVTFEHKVIPWLIAFVGVDFIFYWWHRFSHENNFLWAGHVVHHQSEDYNLAVALRQAVATSFTTVPFYLVLSFVGVPPLIIVAQVSFSTLYQFWIHTQLIKRLPRPIEFIFNTPSHHRVHHAINPEYLDKNYGAIMIVWDRIFGTYEEEVAEPVYGITRPLASFDPFWAQLHYWVELVQLTWRAPRWRDKVLVWWKGPTFWPEGVPKEGRPVGWTKYDPPRPARRGLFVLGFALIILIAFLLMLFVAKLPLAASGGAALAVLIGLQVYGAISDGKLARSRVVA